MVAEQIATAIDAEIVGLSEQYRLGGIKRLVSEVDARARRPGSSLYLVTNFNSEPLAGNIASLAAGVLDKPGWMETAYRRFDDTEPPQHADHHALVRVFHLPGGFRLLVGSDLDERERLAHEPGREQSMGKPKDKHDGDRPTAGIKDDVRPSSFFLNATCLSQMTAGDLDAALQSCNKAIKGSGNAEILTSRGFVYLKRGELTKAMNDYDAALKIEPKLATALYGRGLAKQKAHGAFPPPQDILDARAIDSSIDKRVEQLMGGTVPSGVTPALPSIANPDASTSSAPLEAQADHCSGPPNTALQGFPELEAASRAANDAEIRVFNLTSFGTSATVQEKQQARCDAGRAEVILNREILDAKKQVNRTCGERVIFKCDISCQERGLAEEEKKAAYDCSPAALEDALEAERLAREAEQKKKEQDDAHWKSFADATMACGELSSNAAAGVHEEAADHQKNLAICNANIEACKMVLKMTAGEPRIEGLTCDGK